MAALQSMKPSVPLPSPVTKARYTPRPIINVRYINTPSSRRFLRINRSPLLPRPPFMTMHPVLCSFDPAGSPYRTYKQIRADIDKWCDKQSLPLGAAVYIAVEAFKSGVFGYGWKLMVNRYVIDLPVSEIEQMARPHLGVYYPLVLSFIGSPFLVARSYAVINGSAYGTAYVMKRWRNKEHDILTTMVASFVTAVMYSLVAGMRSPIILPIVGIICALVFGLMSKVAEHGDKQPHFIKQKIKREASLHA
ncbi:hypothetical protein E3N88_31408 [Mikania micrantha]|uniref:Uncharacterized protein n=1 Tax=Mikania micrantha TaxID=192012 RepID=A0A5N6MSA7_9ASTR|nr:hypothetical protein E3N88_31408 [Mikania micrantha]